MQCSFYMRNAKRGRQGMKKAGLYNCDCIEAMREYPDKYFDLAIVDPPYGSGGGGRLGKENKIWAAF